MTGFIPRLTVMRWVILLLVVLSLGAAGAQGAPPKACSDHLDNDGDGLIDYPVDPGCDSRKDTDEYNAPPPPPAACADLLDNDGDGLIDMADPGCTSATDNDEYNAPPTAVKRVAIVLINFTNDQAQPWTVQQVRDIAFTGPTAVSAFYQEASYGKQLLTGDVFGWWTISYPDDPCDTVGWLNAAKQMALSQGVNLDTAYDHVALVFPRSACGFPARSEPTQSFYNGVFDDQTLAHELGHTFGLLHAGGWFCTDASGTQVMLSATCQAQEYADLYDIMGSAYRHFNGWEKAHVGWLTNTQTITQSGQYTISPLEWQPQSHPQTLLISRADGSQFALEFRQRYGFDQGNLYDAVFNGVLIRVVPAMSARTFLLDAHPGGTQAWFDSPLNPGETLTDVLGGVSVTVVSVGASGAVVDVVIG